MENTRIDAFFKRYEKNFNAGLAGNDPNVEAVVINSFANCFVESSPMGVICGKNDAEWPVKVKQGFEFYRSIGTTSMRINSKEITRLDDFHSMVKVGWRYKATKKDGSEVTIDFDIYYLLSHVGADPKIFAYIAGDEQKALRENGLIPEAMQH